MRDDLEKPAAKNDPAVAALLNQAVHHLRGDKMAPAEALLTRALALDGACCDTLHLFGQMRRVQRRFAEAEDFYARARAIEPARPELLFHLGQLLVLMGRFDEAEAELRAAIALKSYFAEAHLELGLLLARLERFAEAENAYRQALRAQPNLIAAKQALSAALIYLKRPKEAEAVAQGALMQARSNPAWFAALEQNRAIALSEQHRYDDALTAFERLQSIAPALPRIDYNRANTLQSMGRLSDAEQAYRQAVARDPRDVKAHVSLNQLLYRLDRADFLQSYDAAMDAVPNDPVLPVEKGRLLYLADRHEEAREAFERALSLAPDDVAAAHGLASVLTRLSHFDKATRIFEKLTVKSGRDTQLRCDFAECLIRAGDWPRGCAEAGEALRDEPNNQLALALVGSAWRALDDPRERALNDYEGLVRVVMLDPPPGFDRMDDFHAALEPYLAGLHRDVREHINQTSRLGTKTMGTLFGAGHDLIERLRVCIDEAVSDYIARMRDVADHPLFRRKTGAFGYWGSWSTRLKDCGFHTNHVHPKGWISSAYYVAVPDAAEDETEKQGWLKFGEAPFATGQSGAIRRSVKPVPGQLVLFPSYMWHGTNPFRSAEARTAIAFDAVPR